MLTRSIHKLTNSGRVSVSRPRKLTCTDVKSLAPGAAAASLGAFLKAMSLTTMHNNLFITYRYSHSQKVRVD